MRRSLLIPERFNGPEGSANGGYACGLVSAHVDGDAEVTLRSPPPLEVRLDVVETPGGVEIRDGETLVAAARRVPFEAPDLPAPLPSWEEAEKASLDYLGHRRHEFPTCFTCGTDREDGLRIFAGPTTSALVASPWIPDASLPNEEGSLSVPMVWAALDCPGAWAGARDLAEEPVVLGRMSASILGPVEVGDHYIAIAWPLGEDGRKSYSATALIDEAGEALALARQTWIAVGR